MTTTVLRTADAWYVRIGSGAVKIDTAATTTAELLRDRAAIDAATDRAAAVSVDRLDLVSPVTTPVSGGRPDDELRVPRQGLGHGSGDRATDVLPQGIRIDQRPPHR